MTVSSKNYGELRNGCLLYFSKVGHNSQFRFGLEIACPSGIIMLYDRARLFF